MVRRRVLVGCHPHPFAGHWQERGLRAEMGSLYPGDDITFETMDLYNTMSVTQADITGDMFNRTHKNLRRAFDAIILPDCGGQWYDMFSTYEQTESEDLFEEDMIVIFNRLIGMLKDGGYLYLSKILMKESDFVETLKRLYGSVITFHRGYSDAEYRVRYIVVQNTQPGTHVLHSWWKSDASISRPEYSCT